VLISFNEKQSLLSHTRAALSFTSVIEQKKNRKHSREYNSSTDDSVKIGVGQRAASTRITDDKVDDCDETSGENQATDERKAIEFAS
jgi:hypothetical protein